MRKKNVTLLVRLLWAVDYFFAFLFFSFPDELIERIYILTNTWARMFLDGEEAV